MSAHLVISHGQNLALIDIIDPDSLEDLGFYEMTDSDFGHDGEGDGVDDVFDHGWVGLWRGKGG